MNTAGILIVRLILGMVMGIVIMRIFRPDWGMIGGAVLGLGLVAVAYLLQMARGRKTKH